jgi:signal transduction histidine kinase
MEQNIKGALKLMLSDIKYEHYADSMHHEEMAFFAEEIKKSSYGKLFDDLQLEVIQDQIDEEDSRISTYIQLDDSAYLHLSCSRNLLEKKVSSFILNTGGLFVFVFVILVSMFVLYVKGQFKSLHCLVGLCSSYKDDKEILPVCDGTYEVKSLREAILSLIDQNDYLCDQKQELFKEAAHELKSPIAVLKARLSLYEKDEEMSKSSFVFKCKEDISHITSKLKELIFLKSIEWDMQLPRVDVNMEDNCKMMQDAFGPILQKKSVQVDSNWEENFVIYTYKDAMQKVLQAVFENIFIHTKQNSTIVVKAKPNEIFIQNEIGGGDDIPLFSSYIGMKMIERLAPKLAYEYKTSSDEKYFYTRLIFHSMEDGSCKI